MKRSILALCSFLTLAACSGSGSISQGGTNLFSLPEVQKGAVVLTINNTKIHQGLLDVLGNINPRIKAQLDNPLTRKKLLESLVDQQLLYQEAVKRGLDKTDEVLIKSYLNQNVIVSNALVEEELNKSLKQT